MDNDSECVKRENDGEKEGEEEGKKKGCTDREKDKETDADRDRDKDGEDEEGAATTMFTSSGRKLYQRGSLLNMFTE